MKVGDLIKIEGGTLRPPWYGEMGVVTSLTAPETHRSTPDFDWCEVALASGTKKFIRSDMIRVLNEGR